VRQRTGSAKDVGVIGLDRARRIWIRERPDVRTSAINVVRREGVAVTVAAFVLNVGGCSDSASSPAKDDVIGEAYRRGSD
jgi:hypothetical protein